MAKRRHPVDGPPGGYSLLTVASELGIDLRAAFRVLMYLPDTRKDVAAWLRERAVHADPAVGLYLEMAGQELWDDFETRKEVVRLLDQHHPRLARRVVNGCGFVIKADEGYWCGVGFEADRRFAKRYFDLSECYSALRDFEKDGKKVVPEFMAHEKLWRELPPVPKATDPDPWARALKQAGVIPGCAWVPISPAVRKSLETEILMKCWLEREPGMFQELLQMAARFGHPLFTVYAELSERQGWNDGLREELVRLDLFHARYRDPPGDVPLLQAMTGPFYVVCSREGFWAGTRWTSNLDEAEHYPAWNHDEDEAFEAALRKAEELTGATCVRARVSARPVQSAVQSSPKSSTRPRRRSSRSKV